MLPWARSRASRPRSLRTTIITSRVRSILANGHHGAPMVETPEQAKAIVDCTKYPPSGRRGAAFNVAAHDDYSGGAETDKIVQANARTMVIVLVETAKGIENVDAIAAVDGVDVVWSAATT
ncbi:aldolase/citrate lyase family protein [Bradyrhizobium sp. TZ2]